MRALSSIEVGVGAANLAEELDGESAPFDTDRVGGLDATQLGGGSGGGKPFREPTGGELAQQGVEAADRPGAVRDQVVVTLGEQAQHARSDPRDRRPAVVSGATRRPRPSGRRGRRSCRCARCRGAAPAPRAPAARRAPSRRRRRAVGPTTRRCRSHLRSPSTAVRTRPRTPTSRSRCDRSACTRTSLTSCS